MSTPSLWDQVEAGQILPAPSATAPPCLPADDAAFEACARAFAQSRPDYQDAVDALAAAGCEPILPPHVSDFLNASPVCLVLGYRFAKRPDLLAWIVSLPPDRAVEVLKYFAGSAQLDIYLELWLFRGTTDPFWELITIEAIEANVRLARLGAWSPSPDSRPH